jgi:hypothetical protein
MSTVSTIDSISEMAIIVRQPTHPPNGLTSQFPNLMPGQLPERTEPKPWQVRDVLT